LPVWKYSGKEVSIEDVEKIEKALQNACFGCGELHSDDCVFNVARMEVSKLKNDN